MFAQRTRQSVIGGSRRRRARHHYDIEPRKFHLVQAEGFSDLPLNTIARDGPRRYAARHGDPNTCAMPSTRGAHDKKHVTRFDAAAAHSVKLFRAR